MIKLKIDEFREGKVTFHISRQDAEDYKRLRYNPFSLKVSDGKEYWLYLGCQPVYFNEVLFVRGKDSSMDNQKIIVEFTEFLKIFELLQSYNKTS